MLKFPPNSPSGPQAHGHLSWVGAPELCMSMADPQSSLQCGNTPPKTRGHELFHFHSLAHGPTNVRSMPTEKKLLKNGEMSNDFIFNPQADLCVKIRILKHGIALEDCHF